MTVQANNMHVLSGRQDNLRGICDINLGGGEFVIKGVRVVESDKGLFVSMPSHKDRDGKYQDIAFPTTAAGRELVNSAVLAEYDRQISHGKEVTRDGGRDR